MIKLVGFQKLDFTTSDGKQIKGTKIHYTYQPTGTRAENTVGSLTDTHFFNSDLEKSLPMLNIGYDYEFKTEFDGRRAVVVGLECKTIPSAK